MEKIDELFEKMETWKKKAVNYTSQNIYKVEIFIVTVL